MCQLTDDEGGHDLRRAGDVKFFRFLQAKEEMEKRTLVAALAGTKCEDAIPMIEMALDDEQSGVRETAARALRAFSSPRAKQALARGERLHLFPTGPLNAVVGNPQSAMFQTCSGLQNDLGLNGSTNWKCEDKHIGFGTNFIGAGAQAIAGYGTVGTWGRIGRMRQGFFERLDSLARLEPAIAEPVRQSGGVAEKTPDGHAVIVELAVRKPPSMKVSGNRRVKIERAPLD